MHRHVTAALSRNDYNFPRPISDVKFNKYIKEVCKEVGIDKEIQGSRINPKTKRKIVGKFPKWELIRSHTCRRSFATNFYGKIPITAIRSVTGHSSEKMLLTYIQETEYDHIDDIHSAMNNIELK
jgi:integrase